MHNTSENKNNGQMIERIFKEKLFYKTGQETAAYFHLRFCHNNKNKVKIFVDASLNPEVINKIIDHDKVKKMREERKRLYQKNFIPNVDADENDDAYKIKPREPYVEDKEPARRKVLTKKKPKNDKKEEEITVDDLSKLEQVHDDTKSGKKKNKKGKLKDLSSKSSAVTSAAAASKSNKSATIKSKSATNIINKSKSATNKSKDADSKTNIAKSKKNDSLNRKKLLEPKRNATTNQNTPKNKNNKKEENKIKKNKENYELMSNKDTLNSKELKNKNSDKNNNKTIKSKTHHDDKNSLPAFARPCAQLKEIKPNDDWKRRERPRYHGIHMHTKCFENFDSSEHCEKTSVFSHYINRAEQLNGGPMIDHMQNRECLYNSMCQDLMTLEKQQEKQSRVYKPRSENCNQCQQNINEAEGVFFKTSYVDETRNLARAAQYRRTNYQQ